MAWIANLKKSKLVEILFRSLVSRKKPLLYVAIVAAVLIAVSMTFRLMPILRAERFTGLITEEHISCIVPDGGKSVMIGDKEVVISPGYSPNHTYSHATGSVDSRLYACEDFDYHSVNTGTFGIPLPGQPDGGEDLLGVKVEVYAQKIGPKEYTIKGSKRFYVKIVE